MLIIWVTAFAAGCVVATLMGMWAHAYTGPDDHQSIGFFWGLAGVIVGIALAFGLRPTRVDIPVFPLLTSGNFRQDAVARPTVGIALALFCLPTVVAAMIA
ncbi:MAG TPA: hypothetical protein VLA35_03435 [Thermoleophilia bacterium]|nr:hypothetical protein [Thermoleophilia bacterium]